MNYITICKWIIISFGAFIIYAGILMLFDPEKARSTIKKAGSTNLINYGEITIRLIIGIAFIIYYEYSKVSDAFKIFGWFLLITSLILYAVPRNIHHNFSVKSADILKPSYLQLISPFAFLFGGLIIFNAI